MTVAEFIAWLQTHPDPEATVEVVEHSTGKGYYDQGGNIRVVDFSPEVHADYIDLRGNSMIAPGMPYYGKRTLLIGAIEQ